MKHKIAEKKPTTLNKLELEIKKVWKSLQPDYAGNLVSSMKNRITALIEAQGDYICY